MSDAASPIPVPNTELPSRLLGLLYQGAAEARPWCEFAEALRVEMRARNVGITLHHATGNGRDLFLMAGLPGDNTDWQAVEATYRAEFLDDDPLRPDLMRPGQVGMVRLDAADTRGRRIVEKFGISACLRVCVAEPGGLRCWVDVVRGRDQDPADFEAADVVRLQALTPHLSASLELFARLQRHSSERAIYESMLDHLGLGCMLLNEQGRLIHMNRVAAGIVDGWPELRMVEGMVRLTEPTAQRSFDKAVNAMIAARHQPGGETEGELLRLGVPGHRLLGLMVYPAPLRDYFRGGQAPGAIVYLSDLGAGLEALSPRQTQSLDRLGRLFSLTPQEATLALLLAYGHTIVEAAREMCIAENAARNYSKKVYAKMGIAGQTELVRTMLRCLSFLR